MTLAAIPTEIDRTSILIVDDHAVVREGLHAMLDGDPSLRVIGEAHNGLEAIELVGALRPQVVLIDINMPEMDGLQATARIKELHPSTTVIILTMHATRSHVLEALRAGASGYLLKDAPRSHVLETIRHAANGEVLISSDLLRGAVEVAQQTAPVLESLTPREHEALVLLARGKTNKEIAKAMTLSAETVKKMVGSIIAKLGASDRTHAAVKALRAGLI
jgi:two-component system, NarL family, response regulator LiaR